MIAIVNRIPDPESLPVGNKSLPQGLWDYGTIVLSYYHTLILSYSYSYLAVGTRWNPRAFRVHLILKSSNSQPLNLSNLINLGRRDISPHHDHDHDQDYDHGHDHDHEDAHDGLMTMIMVDCLLQVDPA